MGEVPFSPDEALTALVAAEVKLIVIGGIAADVHGAGWSTFDLDVVVDRASENLAHLSRALDELDAVYDLPDGRIIRPDHARLISLPGPQLFRTKFGRLDVLKEAGGETYASLRADAVAIQRAGHTLRFASVDALLRMKREANRPKDAKGILALETLRNRKTGQ